MQHVFDHKNTETHPSLGSVLNSSFIKDCQGSNSVKSICIVSKSKTKTKGILFKSESLRLKTMATVSNVVHIIMRLLLTNGLPYLHWKIQSSRWWRTPFPLAPSRSVIWIELAWIWKNHHLCENQSALNFVLQISFYKQLQIIALKHNIRITRKARFYYKSMFFTRLAQVCFVVMQHLTLALKGGELVHIRSIFK